MSLRERARNRVNRGLELRWRTRPDVSVERAIVIGGCPRSGTTLVRKLLDAHPRICCGPESELLLPGRLDVPKLELGYGLPAARILAMRRASTSQTRFVEAFFGAYRELRGKPRWAEKTPLNLWHAEWILEHFPETRFVHVIRDGRDTAASLRTHPDRRVVDGEWIRVPRVRPLEDCVLRWVRSIEKGKRLRTDPRYLEVRYEELVREPRATLERLLRFVDEPLDPALLERATRATERGGDGARPVAGGAPDAGGPIQATSIGRWRTDFTPADVALFKRLANPQLVELGYAADDRW